MMLAAIYGVLGVAESDVRSVTPCPNLDAYDVRLWNGRRLRVSGFVLAMARRWR
jgi:hypothetical protein